MEIDRLLAWMRWVTEEFQKQAGEEWVVKNQSDKVREELDEVAKAVTTFLNGVDKLASVDDPLDGMKQMRLESEVVDEGIDLVMATATMFHVLGISDAEIAEGLRRVMNKLENRIKTGYYSPIKEQHIEHWALWKDENEGIL